MLIITNIFLFISFIFIISIIIKRNDIADVFWGPGILFASLTSFIIYYKEFNKLNILSLALIFLISLWAMRIFVHIGTRFLNKKEEDFRYKTWRENWKYFYTRSYLQVYLLQGLLMIFVASSSIVFFKNINYINYTQINILTKIIFVFGMLAAIIFLIFETIADIQLNRFITLKKENKTKDKYLKTGLWSLSRHPNYFGEVAFWWSIFICCFSLIFTNFNIIYLLLILISPLTITFLILKVSGIPMLEKNNTEQEWEDYKKKTPAFFPKVFVSKK
jgi:steroid 5-alpha reductase family enzyme